MSMIPMMYRDWWDEWETPSRLIDQNFGLGLRRDDLLSSLRSPIWRGSNYLRPWRDLTRQTSGTSTLQADKEQFQVILDVQQFTPNEISVKTVGRTVVVEGKHEEKQDEHGFVSRHFVRKYLLPTEIEAQQVSSTLSSDGVLTVTAPRKAPQVENSERVVPIQPIGPSRPAPTLETTATAPIKPAEVQIPVTQQ